MKLALFGARGTIGSRIAAEALHRGHTVTALLHRDAKAQPPARPGLATAHADVLDVDSVARAVAGHDAVASAVAPELANPGTFLPDAARALLAGVSRAGVRRLVVVGGAGSLEVAPGLQLVDTPEFHAAWKPVALSHREALAVYRASAALDWTYFSPAALIAPGERTGKYRLGFDALLVDEQGNSRISAEDFAVAVLDELEHPQHPRRRITVAY